MNLFDQFRNAVKLSYDFESWEDSLIQSLDVLTKRFMSSAIQIEGYEFETRIAISGYKHSFTDHFRSTENDQVQIAIEIMEFKTVGEAHEAMLNVLTRCMAVDLPRVRDLEITAGDVGFGGHGETQTAVFFTRQNVFIHVFNVGKELTSVAQIVEQVDQEIISHIELGNK